MDRATIPTEWEEAHKLMDWIALQPYKKYFVHIPNEAKRSWWLGKKLKHLGVKSGVSDYFLPVPISPYHGLWLELKRTRFYRISKEQQEWLDLMNAFFYRAEIAYGADHAIEIVKDYTKNINLDCFRTINNA